MLATLEISKAAISPRQAAMRKYPLKAILGEAGSSKCGDGCQNRQDDRVQTPNAKPRHKGGMGLCTLLAMKVVDWHRECLVEYMEDTDTIKFIALEQIPKSRRKYVTYARIVCNKRPQKEEVNRTRIAVDGNLINCPFDCGTPTADMITVKLLLNSVISTPRAKWMTLDIIFFISTHPWKEKTIQGCS